MDITLIIIKYLRENCIDCLVLKFRYKEIVAHIDDFIIYEKLIINCELNEPGEKARNYSSIRRS